MLWNVRLLGESSLQEHRAPALGELLLLSLWSSNYMSDSTCKGYAMRGYFLIVSTDLQCLQYPLQALTSRPHSLSTFDARLKDFQIMYFQVAPCHANDVASMLTDLKSKGMDLGAFQAKELFQLIEGRTLW